jgi:hypothetical protein
VYSAAQSDHRSHDEEKDDRQRYQDSFTQPFQTHLVSDSQASWSYARVAGKQIPGRQFDTVGLAIGLPNILRSSIKD